MPFRRSILAATTVAASAGLAGCSVGGANGLDAAIRGDAAGVPDPESVPVVARDESAGQVSEHGCPAGLVNARSRVHERPRTSGGIELVLVSEYRVIPGENVCTSRGSPAAGSVPRARRSRRRWNWSTAGPSGRLYCRTERCNYRSPWIGRHLV